MWHRVLYMALFRLSFVLGSAIPTEEYLNGICSEVCFRLINGLTWNVILVCEKDDNHIMKNYVMFAVIIKFTLYNILALSTVFVYLILGLLFMTIILNLFCFNMHINLRPFRTDKKYIVLHMKELCLNHYWFCWSVYILMGK